MIIKNRNKMLNEFISFSSLLSTSLLILAVKADLGLGPNTAEESGKIPAVFSFGDSILDTGNNNGLNTLSKCNFRPYGRDFQGGIPTGRFCNGKVPSDLVAEGLGIKQILPAYLDPNLKNEDLPTGVSFASGGSGCDPLTASIQGILSLADQLRLFQEYIVKLKGVVGEDRTKTILNNSLILVSAGNNDIAITYSITSRRLEYDFPSYANTLVNWASTFIKDLYEIGVRRIGFMSALPLGCLPGARTVGGGLLRYCVELSNQGAQLFNSKLSSQLDSIKNDFPDANLVFVDVYSSLLDLVQNPQKYGFEVVKNGCCGTGTSEVGETCNEFNQFTCGNASTYVFWDAAHPTERAYRILVSQMLQNDLRAFF